MNELRRGKTSLAYDESEIYLLAKLLLLLLKMIAMLTQLLPPPVSRCPPTSRVCYVLKGGGHGAEKVFLVAVVH